MINRSIFSMLKEALLLNKVVIIYGARQVGKTTLCKELMKGINGAVYLTCDDPTVREALTDKSVKDMQRYLGECELLILDEAQCLAKPGVTLKLLHDANSLGMKIVATGSSAFELASKVQEPLTGRKIEFHLYPLTLGELVNHCGFRDIASQIEERMVFGCYPHITLADGKNRESSLYEITQSYLFKDILALDSIKNPEKIEKLLMALALQIGSEVSYNELARFVGIDKSTVERYLRILEQAFIVFRLNPFSRNERKGLQKNRKVYFWDTGIRNALVRNVNTLDKRSDVGPLWENFIIAERMKQLRSARNMSNTWFWRAAKPGTGEVDYLEENGGELRVYEIKWRKGKSRLPKAFTDDYGEITKDQLFIVNKETWPDFLEIGKER